MKHTMNNLTKLRIAGMLSEAALREVEKKILEIPKDPDSSIKEPILNLK